MRDKKFKGDRIEVSSSEAHRLVNMVGELNARKALDIIAHPSLTMFNLNIKSHAYPDEIISCKIMSRAELPEGVSEGSDFENAVYFRVHQIEGDTAYALFEAIVGINSSGMIRESTRRFEYGEYLSDECINTAVSRCFFGFIAIQNLLLHHRQCFRESIETTTKHMLCKKGKGVKSKRPGKVKVYKLNNISDEIIEKAGCSSEKYTRYCDAWGVRGHYRHYASGKTAYVKPYVKGRCRDKYTGREYVLFKEAAE